MCGERLELLAVVRGLEALDGPARVTLVTKSRYVSRGMRFGMTEWRANDWQWERFGRVVPVKDHDLWQRVDRALLFHQVQCQAWQFDSDAASEEPASSLTPLGATAKIVRQPCGDNVPKACEIQALPVLQVSHLAPPKHRARSVPRVRKRRLGPQNAGLKGRLTATLADKAATLRETLQGLVAPSQNLATGAA